MKKACFFAMFLLATPVVCAQDAAPTQDVEQIFRDLGHEDFDKREIATLKLIGLSKTNPKILEKVKVLSETTKDPEVKNRALAILRVVAQPEKKPESKKQFDVPQMPQIPGLENFGKLFQGEDLKKLLEGSEFKKIFEQLGLPNDVVDKINELLKGFGMLDKDSEKKPLAKPKADVKKKEVTAPEKAPEKAPLLTDKTNFFGIGWKEVSEELRFHLHLDKKDGGFLITDVVPNTYAAKNGLKPHDIVLSVDGKPAMDPEVLKSLKQKEATVVVVRNGERVTLKLPKW